MDYNYYIQIPEKRFKKKQQMKHAMRSARHDIIITGKICRGKCQRKAGGEDKSWI